MRRLFIIIPTLLMCVSARAQEDYVSDDAGKSTGAVWAEVGATKVLPYNLSLGLDVGFRTGDWFRQASRVDVGLGLAWKPTKHWKLGVGYTFLYKHSTAETAYKTEYKYRAAGADDNTDMTSFVGAPTYTDATTTYTYRGKNVNTRYTEAYWRPKHRVSIDAAYTYKLWKTLRLTLRERYQLTLMPSKTVAREKVIDKYRDPSYAQATAASEDDIDYDEVTRYWQEGETVYALDLTDPDATATDVTEAYLADGHDYPNADKDKSSKTLHTLRSRLTFEIDRKGWVLAPYAYAELFNDLTDRFHMDKVRASAGVEWSVTPRHRLQLGYVFNHENDDDGDQNIHAISVGYKFKF